jgi:hypothetical protein
VGLLAFETKYGRAGTAIEKKFLGHKKALFEYRRLGLLAFAPALSMGTHALKRNSTVKKAHLDTAGIASIRNALLTGIHALKTETLEHKANAYRIMTTYGHLRIFDSQYSEVICSRH